jgi:hypothetical protein
MGLVPRNIRQNAQPHVCVCVGHSGKAPCGSDAAVFELGKPTATPIRLWLQAADGLQADQCRVGQSLTHCRSVGRPNGHGPRSDERAKVFADEVRKAVGRENDFAADHKLAHFLQRSALPAAQVRLAIGSDHW